MTTKMQAAVPDQQDLQERSVRYGTVERALRQSRVPGVLAQEPVFQRIAAERKALLEAEAELNGRHAAWQQRVQLARAEHQEKMRQAALYGNPPPSPFVPEPWTEIEHSRSLYDGVHAILEGHELGLLKERADEWRDHIEQELSPLRARVAEAKRQVQAAEDAIAPYMTALEQLPASAQKEEAVEMRVIRPGANAGEQHEAWCRQIEGELRESRRSSRTRVMRPR